MERVRRRHRVITLSAAIAVVVVLGAVCGGAVADDAAGSLSNRPDEVQIKAELADILSDSRYREDGDHTWLLLRVLEAVIEPVLEFLDSIFGGRVRSLLENSPILYWTLVAVLIVLALAIFAHIFAVLVNAFGESDEADTGPVAAASTRAPPADALRAGRDAAGRGEYTRAIVRTYLAILHELDRQDRLRFSDSETNRRMVRQIEDSDLRGRLMAITGTVDGIIYGNRPADRQTYERVAGVAAGVGLP